NETISGADIGVYGYINGGSASITGGTISANSRGVWLTNFLSDFSIYPSSYSNVPGTVLISGTQITGPTGVYVEDADADFDADNVDDATGHISATISGATITATGNGTGVLISGPNALASLTSTGVALSATVGNTAIGIDDQGGTLSLGTGNSIS